MQGLSSAITIKHAIFLCIFIILTCIYSERVYSANAVMLLLKIINNINDDTGQVILVLRSETTVLGLPEVYPIKKHKAILGVNLVEDIACQD